DTYKISEQNCPKSSESAVSSEDHSEPPCRHWIGLCTASGGATKDPLNSIINL
ncbi:hypothetical protein H0H93_009660, partial [Arthromyces matolae]